ncbi:MAG: hypothetical protein WC718_01315 [Phycisphaerales bacterium]|jgi:hypothetical protein
MRTEQIARIIADAINEALRTGAYKYEAGHFLPFVTAKAIEAALVGEGWSDETLEAMCRAHDDEDAAMMGEPSLWAIRDRGDFDGSDAEWETYRSDRLAAMRAAVSVLSASPIGGGGDSSSVAKSAAGDASHLTASETPCKSDDSLDAQRWRALMRCGRIKMQGSAGVDPHTGERRNGSNVHFGAEFWPEPLEPRYRAAYPESAAKYDEGTKWGLACLTALADELIELEARSQDGTTERQPSPREEQNPLPTGDE